MHPIIAHNLKSLSQLLGLLSNLGEEAFTANIASMHNSTLGKHARHIIEFYHCLFDGMIDGSVNYDSRPRQMIYEQSLSAAKAEINHIVKGLTALASDTDTGNQQIVLVSGEYGSEPVMANTTPFRELLYMADHTVHHLAVMRLGVEALLPEISLDDTIGFAPSTISHLSHVHPHLHPAQ